MDKGKQIFRNTKDNLHNPYFYGYLEEAVEKGYNEILVDILPKVKVGWLYKHAWYNEDGSLRFVCGARLMETPDISGNFISIDKYNERRI